MIDAASLLLPHASRRRPGGWHQDDYDVMSGDRAIGRIFRSNSEL
jgi:hypothetical protein